MSDAIPVINYSLGRAVIANPDGSNVAEVTGGRLVAGPGRTSLGEFPQALDFSTGGRLRTVLPRIPTLPIFSIRLLLKAAAAEQRQDLFACPGLATAVTVDRLAGGTNVRLTARVQNSRNDAVAVLADIPVNAWTLVDVVYDLDTLAVFVNGQLSDFAASHLSALKPAAEKDVLLAGAGQIAALQISEGIPALLETVVDARRTTPEWHISRKVSESRSGGDLGRRTGELLRSAETATFTQCFEQGAIVFSAADSVCAAMRGAIYQLWRSQPPLQGQLGRLIKDELDGGTADSRKSVFENGAIYWSAATGAVPVVGKRVFADYVKLGEAKHPVGLPKSSATAVAGGIRQEFRSGVLYVNGKVDTAFALHGPIAAKYFAAGRHEQWGLPVSDVTPIRKQVEQSHRLIGHSSRFERGAAMFLKAGNNDAFLLHGEFLDVYLDYGGPQSDLGFPTSDIGTIADGVKHAAFEHGAIVQIGRRMPVVVLPFTVFISRVDTDESEESALFQGENDLYMTFKVRQNGHEVYRKRYPETGDDSGDNIVEPKLRTQAFHPADPKMKLSLELDVWEADTGDDDHIGVFHHELNAGNLWGLLDNPNGIFRTGKISQINSIEWSVQPATNNRTPFDFWEAHNGSTTTISESQYAAAFCDVDSEPEWYSPADLLRGLYYDLAVKGIAAQGNCFGMSTEAIFAWKGASTFGRPLKRYKRFEDIESEVNIKQCYQLGAEPIWWFLKQLATLNTRDPKDVFKETRDMFKSGLNPVLCVASNWKFDNGHCLLPIAWDDSEKPWKITVFDPNKGNAAQIVKINPTDNTFDYLNGKYKGGAGLSNAAGGHLHYMPWGVLCRRPTTPVGALLDFGTTLLLGASATTTNIVDSEGRNLYANLNPNEMAAGVENKFVSIPSLDGPGSLGGQLLIRRTADGSKAGSFAHQMSGSRSGELEYGLHLKRQAFKLGTSIATSENNTLDFSQLGTPEQKVSVLSPKDKVVSMGVEHRLGGPKDFVRVQISRIPVRANLKAQLGFRPGGGEVDILAGGDPVEARVAVTGYSLGQRFEQTYDTRLEGGTRLVLSHARSSNVLKVGRIDNVFGPMNRTFLLKKR